MRRDRAHDEGTTVEALGQLYGGVKDVVKQAVA